MAAPIVIRSTDLGAPVLSGVEGSLSAIIRYAAPLLGWDIIFDAGTKIVIRAKTGSRLFVRIDDTLARGGLAPRFAEVRAYESMTDIDTGLGLVGPSYLTKSYDVNTTPREYLIVGDGTYISMVNAFRGATWAAIVYGGYWGFGDGERVFPFIDYSAFMLFGGPDNATYLTNHLVYGDLYAAKNIFYLHRSIDGTLLNVPSALVVNAAASASRLGAVAYTGKPAYPYKGQLLLGRPVTGQGSSTSTGLPHTYVPGLFDPLHVSGLITGEVITDGTDTYFPVIHQTNNIYGYALIKIAGEFRS